MSANEPVKDGGDAPAADVSAPDVHEELLRALVEKGAELEELRALLKEVQEHESRLIAEAHAREEQLVDQARAREARILREAREREELITLDANDAIGQIQALTSVQAEARAREAQLARDLAREKEREARLEAELAALRAQPAPRGVLEVLRFELRRARAELDAAVDRAETAEVRVHELQSVVESLGRERAALRSEAGALRARVEGLSLAEDRARRLLQELEQARRDAAFLNHAKES